MSNFDYESYESYEDDPDTLTACKWNPTPAQMLLYKEREVELAIDNIKHFGCSVLSSEQTIAKAYRQLKPLPF